MERRLLQAVRKAHITSGEQAKEEAGFLPEAVQTGRQWNIFAAPKGKEYALRIL